MLLERTKPIDASPKVIENVPAVAGPSATPAPASAKNALATPSDAKMGHTVFRVRPFNDLKLASNVLQRFGNLVNHIILTDRQQRFGRRATHHVTPWQQPEFQQNCQAYFVAGAECSILRMLIVIPVI